MAGKKRASSGENGDGPKEKKNKNQTDFSNLDFSTKKCDFKVRTFCRRGRGGGFHLILCAEILGIGDLIARTLQCGPPPPLEDPKCNLLQAVQSFALLKSRRPLGTVFVSPEQRKHSWKPLSSF